MRKNIRSKINGVNNSIATNGIESERTQKAFRELLHEMFKYTGFIGTDSESDIDIFVDVINKIKGTVKFPDGYNIDCDIPGRAYIFVWVQSNEGWWDNHRLYSL